MKTQKYISRAIYGKPWAILEPDFLNIHNIYQNYLKGNVPLANFDDDGDGDENIKSEPYKVVGKTAIVSLSGVILKHASLLEQVCGAQDIDSFLANVTAAFNDTNVENIVIDVNSPGGGVVGVPEAAEAIREMSKQKQICAFSDSLCASAGVWIASAASSIIVTPSSQIGSCGVYVLAYDQSQAFAQEGIRPVLIKAGTWKGDLAQGMPISDATIARIQADVDETNSQFRAFILTNRTIAEDMLQGQCVSGLNAVKAGFADAVVQNIQELIDMLNAELN
jgi:protease-4